IEIAEISGEALRRAFADFITMDSVSGNDSDRTSERSDIEILPVVEKFTIPLTPRGDLLEGPHPVHGSSSGNNFLVDPAKNLWHCFRCGTGGDALGLVAVVEGFMECSEAVPGGLRGDRFKKTVLIAKEKYGLEIEPLQSNEPANILILETGELKTLGEQIKLIPPDTDKAEILTMLEPMLREIAKLNPVQGNAILRHVVRPHFSLTTQETKDYENLLKQYRKVPPALNVEDETLGREDLIEILESAIDEKRIHPAQDFIDGQLYFGVKIKGVDYVVRSDREICKLSDLHETHGIAPTQTFVGTNHFSTKGIAKFLRGDGHVGSHELFRRIKDEYLKRYYWFQYEEDAVFLTIWIMGTYVYRIFQYYPYAWLKASKNSGKTHLLNLSAMLAFNGDSSVTPTEAVLFRDVSENLVTMCVDEVEKLRSVDKEKYGAIMSLLNAGFQKDGKVKRVEKDESGQFVTKSFSVYSPKILAGINHLEDVLQDRTVRLDIIRKMKGEPAERLKKNRAFQEFITDLRDDCYAWALEHAGDIAEMIDSDEVSRMDWFRDLVNRDLDLWEPIIFIGTLVDRAAGNTLVSESLARKSQKSVEEKQENNEFA
ncbi:MAG: hypothetical protein JNM63_10225, partial [Spirochaetia bacterium]|nr:hypothetical protein [Spirochaetia bacterium]